MNRCLGLAMAVCVATAGCATTSYQPAQSPRIALVSDGYVRDGTKFKGRNFASGLGEAVQGNRRAEEVASTAHGLMIGGFVLTVVASGAVGGGVVAWANGLEKDRAGNVHSTSQSNIGLGVMLGGFVIDCIAFALMDSGRAHELDAINIYNDGVSLPAAQPPPLPSRGDSAPPAPAVAR